MKSELTSASCLNRSENIGLHSLVDRVSSSSIYAATCRHSFIINDIPAHLMVNTDEHMLATIFGNLLNSVISNTKESCIRISARIYGKIALISMKESHQVNNRVSINLRQLQQMAIKIGGAVSINSDRERTSTIIFSFTNNLPIAA